MRGEARKLVDAATTATWLASTHPAKLALGIALFSATWWDFGLNYYYGKWLGFGVVSLVILFSEVSKKFGPAAALNFVYLLWHVLYFAINPDNRYAPVGNVTPNDLYDLTALKLYIMESGFKLLLVLAPLMVIEFDRRAMRDVGGRLACVFLFLNLAAVFWQAATVGCSGVNSCGGVLMNPSLNATVAAVALPFAFKYFNRSYAWLMVGMTLLAAVVGGTSLGLGMIAAFLVLRDWRLIALSPVVLGLGWAFFGRVELFSSGDRFPMWAFFMQEWARNKTNWWFGTGFGSFGVFSINLQNQHHVRDGYWWVWMHNDWLQGLFETGIAGSGLMLASFLDGARRLWKRREIPEMQALLLFGLCMGVNYPLHIGLPCVFGAWLILLALHRDASDNDNESHSQGEIR